MACFVQALVEFGQRSLAEHEHRVTIRELIQHFLAFRPFHAALALVLRIEAYQTQFHCRHAGWTLLHQKISEPLRSDVAHVKSFAFVVPYANFARLFHRIQRNMQSQHARSAQHHLMKFELWRNKRHTW